MRKFLFQIIILLTGIALALFLFMRGPSLSGLPFLSEQTVLKEVTLGSNKFKVEIADTPAKRKQGLGDKTSLGENEGMLFIFDKRGRYPFWMKGMNFALDFIWIRDNKVVDMLYNVQPPAPNTPDSALPVYESSEEVDKVLELPGGSINKYNIKVGDDVSLI